MLEAHPTQKPHHHKPLEPLICLWSGLVLPPMEMYIAPFASLPPLNDKRSRAWVRALDGELTE